MEGLEVGLAQTINCPAATGLLRFAAGLVMGGLFQLLAGAVSELGGGSFGEGDCRNAANGRPPRRHQVHDPLDQAGGLSGAGAGLHEQRFFQLFADLSSGVNVAGNELGGHCHSSSSPPNSAAGSPDGFGPSPVSDR